MNYLNNFLCFKLLLSFELVYGLPLDPEGGRSPFSWDFFLLYREALKHDWSAPSGPPYENFLDSPLTTRITVITSNSIIITGP